MTLEERLAGGMPVSETSSVVVRADSMVILDATNIIESAMADFSQRMGEAASRIDAALPPEICKSDPALAERRRCAYAVLSSACPHYMAETTVSAALDIILEDKP